MPAPIPRDPACSRCPHTWHGLPCDRAGCDCDTAAWHAIWPDPDYPITG